MAPVLPRNSHPFSVVLRLGANREGRSVPKALKPLYFRPWQSDRLWQASAAGVEDRGSAATCSDRWRLGRTGRRRRLPTAAIPHFRAASIASQPHEEFASGNSALRPDTSVGVVVPTHNSQNTLRACLESIRAQTYPCSVVVVDNRSSDSTPQVGRELADTFLSGGPERSAQRNAGARVLDTDVVGFIDSDMELEPTVVAEVVSLAAAGVQVVVVPEYTVGEGFWASVRAFERSFYVGDKEVEAARFFSRSLFTRLGGFDESLTGPEDWDLTRRARDMTIIGRTRSGIRHQEGRLSFSYACAKKAYYAEGLWAYAGKHGYRAALGAVNRRYLRQPWRLAWPHPLLGAGVIALKVGELTAVARTLILTRHASQRRRLPRPPTT